MRKVRFAVCLLLVSIVAYASAGLPAGAQPKPTVEKKKTLIPPFEPVQPIHDMMEGQKKLYTEIKEGILDEQWDEAVKSAWILAEIANVNRYQHKSSEYKGLAKRMSKQCADLAKLLKKHDASSARQALGKVGQTCGACHDKFRED